uniref:Uncharacterized protein n=1 Tax=Opuntia streptacantha TaxID=393608 RepID=A0A7C9ACP3_OPUST
MLRPGKPFSTSSSNIAVLQSKSMEIFLGLLFLESSSLESSHSLHTSLRACTTSPMKGRWDTSGCTHIDAIAATFATLSKDTSEDNRHGSMIDSKPSLLVRSGLAQATRFS